jgi:hypothetical protein
MPQRQAQLDPVPRLGRRWLRVTGSPPRPAQCYHGAAPQQDQHTAERCRENLLRLRTERDTNIQLAHPPAERIGGEAEGAGDGEQEPKSAKEAEGDGSHLGWKEVQCKLAVPGARFAYRNGGVKIADHLLPVAGVPSRRLLLRRAVQRAQT